MATQIALLLVLWKSRNPTASWTASTQPLKEAHGSCALSLTTEAPDWSRTVDTSLACSPLTLKEHSAARPAEDDGPYISTPSTAESCILDNARLQSAHCCETAETDGMITI